MIRKFRSRFILVAISSLAIVLFVSIGTLILVTFSQARQESSQVMDTLVRNNGQLTPQNSQEIVGNATNIFSPGQGNPESVYQYRYFTVFQQANTEKVITQQNIYQVTKKQIINISNRILNKKYSNGVVKLANNIYRYQVVPNKTGPNMIVFLNISLIYARSWSLLRVGLLLTIGALVFFAIIVSILSKRAIKPIIDAYKKQQLFITNAGHELKTPLAIISANTEMEEMIGHESEWTQSTKQQTNRLTTLINRLIAMTRLGETGDLVLSKVNFSNIVSENSKNFSSMMKNDHLKYQVTIQSGLYIKAEKRSLGEIVNILLDNAHKYCLEGGKIEVVLHKSRIGKNAILKVSNSFKKEKGADYSNFFERFYRADKSHNSKKDGFGIGLSMARALVNAFNGKINVNYANQVINFEVSFKLVK